MGAWGAGTFENDDAQDWLSQIANLKPADLMPLFERAETTDYLESPESSVIVAAGEAVAALNGAPAESAPHAIVEWAGENKGVSLAELAPLAMRAVQKVRTHSELKDLWLEADGLNDWSAALRDLERRLAG